MFLDWNPFQSVVDPLFVLLGMSHGPGRKPWKLRLVQALDPSPSEAADWWLK